MDLKTRINQAVQTAMRAGDDLTRNTLRLVLAAIKQSEVDQRIILDDNAVFNILQKELKTRCESMEDAKKANRSDIVNEIEAEMEVIKRFLPEEISDDDLMDLARIALAEVKASSIADMGKVMQVLLPRIQGRAPGNRVSQVVRSLLQN